MSKPIRTLAAILMMVFVGVALGGCRRTVEVTATPMPSPTPTATPLSVALPTVAPQATFGGDERPYQVLYVRPEGGNNGAAFQTYLNNNSGFIFTVKQAKANADILTALCGNIPTLALVDGWTLVAAQAQGCGRPLLQYTRGTDDQTGVRSDLIVTNESAASTAAGFKGLIFCRLSATDLQTWILPVLMMRTAADFDPLADFVQIRDVPDLDTLVTEVAERRCVGALPAGTLKDYRVRNQGPATQFVKVFSTSPELPFGGLVASSQFPISAAERLGSALARDPSALKGVIDADGVRVVTSADFEALRQFLLKGRFDPAAIR